MPAQRFAECPSGSVELATTSQPLVRLARCEALEGTTLAQALATVWPAVPAIGRHVALLAMPVGPQGVVDDRAVPRALVEAAVAHLTSQGARVTVVCVPGRVDETRALAEEVAALQRSTAVEVVVHGSGTPRALAGPTLSSASVLTVVAEADDIALLAVARPHQQHRVAGPLVALADALVPAARERLWRGATTPEACRAALLELAASLSPAYTAVWLGSRLAAMAGGDDVEAVDKAASRCLGLETPNPPLTTGLDPTLVQRASASARDDLPRGPDRYPGVDASLCTRCSTCVGLCPTGAITLPELSQHGEAGRSDVAIEFDYNACLRCGICAAACPDFAIAPSVRPLAARLVEPAGLNLTDEDVADDREAAVPPAAALALGADAIDPPPRRPQWLDSYEAPDRFEVARQRARRQEPIVPRATLPHDGAVRLVIAPNWGFHDNRTSLGVAYLAGALGAAGQSFHVTDLAHQLRVHDPVLTEALEVLGDPAPNGGFYGPRMPLILQAAAPDAWGDGCPTLARQVHESARRDAERITDPGALHALTVADSNVTYVFALGTAIRALGGRVVLGGPSMSHPPTTELALRVGVADAVVVGEGESALVALAVAHAEGGWDELQPLAVPGLHVLRDDALVAAPNYRNRALDALALPDWTGQHFPADFIPLLASRGCVTRCSFCSEQTISPKFAQRSVEDVLTEMDLLHERTGYTIFEFNDDLLNGNERWLRSLCAALVARGAPYRWQGLCRPHRMTRELLELMRAAGCVQITYGVQHFSAHMLQIMGRREAPDPIRRVLDDTLDLGIMAFVDIIIGHPGETEEDVDITLAAVRDLVRRYPHVRINQNPFNYIYGSAVDIDPAAHGVTVDRFDGAVPARLEHAADVTRRFVTGYQQEPGHEAVIDRLNRLAWAVFSARMPQKIPILDEELPFCNDNCLHCGVADIMKTANVVPTERVVESLYELAPQFGGRVMFAVSELTIRPDFIKIIKTARRAGMHTVALVTNGRMFAYPKFTERTVAAGLTHALVSVYGPTARVHQSITRTPRSFEQTLAGLEDLLRYPSVRVMTNSVITKKNYRYLPQMVELLAGLGVQNINLSFVQIIGAAATYSRALVPTIEEVLPHLKDAVDLGVGLGRNMGIGGLPYCVLKGYEHHFGVDDLTVIANSDPSDNITERSPYTKASACGGCAYNAVCLGMQEEYLARNGEGALEPYHGRRLDRRPDSEIVRAMFPDMQYTDAGLPSSLFSESSAPSPGVVLVERGT